MEKIDGMSFLDLLYGDVSDWTRTEAFTSFNYLNNEIEFDERYQSYTPDLYKNVDQYRPSRALSSTRFTYIWNGWSDGKTTLPNTMGVELRNLLREYADDPEDKTYPDYRQRVHFMEKRAPEELCDTVTDPGCLTNLANDPEYETMITGFRTRLEQLMIDTGDHELANYRVFLRLMANDYASTE